MARVNDALAVLELRTQNSGHVKCCYVASILMMQMPVSQESDDDQGGNDAKPD